jgi:hypothetical protein
MPLLSVAATQVADAANASLVVPTAATFSGTASFGSLSISGSLIGTTPVTVSGDVAANTTLFSGNGVTIVGNAQIIDEHVACTKAACTVRQTGIHVHALAIYLDEVAIGSQTVSGEIVLGGSDASVD